MNIRERIADLLKREPVVYDEDEDYLSVETANRLAALLVAELGLTEEWGVGYRECDGIGLVIKREGRTDAEILNMEHRYDDHQGYSVVSRHATPWTPA